MSSVMWDGRELAELYDRISDVQYRSGRMLLDKMHLKKEERVLDVGCGTGRLALYASDVVGPAGIVIGIDPSPHRINVAESKLRGKEHKNVQFMVGEGEDLSKFPDNSFDHVYYSSVFHWIDDKRKALGEAHRVLQPGGNVGMTTVDKSQRTPMWAAMEEMFSKGPYAGRVDMARGMHMLVDRQELVDLLSEAGFERIDIDYVRETQAYSSPEQFIDFIKASSFGNFMQDVPEELRPRAVEDMKKVLEKGRTDKGIEFESMTMYAVAYKP